MSRPRLSVVLVCVLLAVALLSGCQPAAPATPTTDVGSSLLVPMLTALTPAPVQPLADYPIAFWNRDGVAVASGNGAIVRQLTNGDHYDVAWSPDGRTLAYKAEGDGLHVLTLESGQDIKIAKVGTFETYCWSPDGTRIAYEDSTANADGLYIVDVASGQSTKIVTGDLPSNPSWSPDGALIAFAYSGANGKGVRVVSPDGKTSKQVSDFYTTAKPAWTPDSRQLLLVRTPAQGSGFDLVLAQADGSGTRKLLSGEGKPDGGDPQWSPDGRRLLFFGSASDDKTTYNRLWVVGPDGKEPQLYAESERLGYASWSPDGKAILFTSDKDVMSQDDPTLVHVMDVAGTEEYAVAVGGGAAWSPKPAPATLAQMGKALELDVPITSKPFTGLWAFEPDADLLVRLGLPAGNGMLVGLVIPGSPASAAGLAPQDLLTTINGKAVNTSDGYNQIMDAVKPGQKVTLQFQRGKETKKVELTTTATPANRGLYWNRAAAALVAGNAGDPFVYYVRGQFDSDAALDVRFFSRAIELDGSWSSPYLARGDMSALLDFPAAAKADLQKVKELSRDAAMLKQADELLASLK